MRSHFYLDALPPSVNQLYANVGNFNRKGRFGSKRVKSEAYHNWLQAAGMQLRPQVKHLHRGTVDVIFCFGRNSGRQDVANLEKALADLLVSLNVMVDDTRIESLLACWSPVEGVFIEVADTCHRMDAFEVGNGTVLHGGGMPPKVYLPFSVSKAGQSFDKGACDGGKKRG